MSESEIGEIRYLPRNIGDVLAGAQPYVYPDGRVGARCGPKPRWVLWSDRVLPRFVRRALARAGGFFWLPCPICERPFAGYEWADRKGLPSSIPRDATPSRGQGICPSCTRRGLGWRP